MSDPSALGTAGPIAEASPALIAGGTGGPVDAPDRPRSLASDAWHDLCRRPLFLISVALIAILLVLATFWLNYAAIRGDRDERKAIREGIVQVMMLLAPFLRDAERVHLNQLIRAYTD